MSFFNKLKKLLEIVPAAESVDGSEKLLVLTDPEGEGVTMSATLQQIADLGGGGGAGYLEYSALVSQSVDAVPTVTIVKNTLGDVPVWSRLSVGNYRLTLAGAFPAGKVIVHYPGAVWNGGDGLSCFIPPQALGDSISFNVFDTAAEPLDLEANLVPISVFVYP